MFISIKWKLTAALISLSAALVLTYVFIAKSTFESDKISYVFDSDSAQIEKIANDFDQKVNQAVFYANALLASYDLSSKTLSPAYKKLFEEQSFIKAIDVQDQKTGTSLLRINQGSSDFPPEHVLDTSTKTPQAIQAHFLENHLLSLTLSRPAGDTTLSIRMLADLSGLSLDRPGLFSIFEGQILKEGRVAKEESEVNAIYGIINGDRTGTFFQQMNGDRTVLASLAKSKILDLRFVTLTPKSQILKALDILYQRSIAFLLLSMSITLAIALFLSSGITKKLASLTEAATRIGAGDFKQNRNVKSNDEVGVLSRAFQAMGTEIERLLIETKDKVRMEAELKTASLVQESLFPARANFISGTFEVSGHYATSTECGGDWWYYFERDGALYIAIADATGHGTPAALITSAARSVFSTLETSKMTLQEMMTAWDHAVASCSNGKVFMTAQLYRFEIASGRVDYINASHEPPLHLKYECEKFEGEYIVPQTNSTLGEKRGGAWAEEKFQIDAGQSIVLLTDGVFALEDPEKKTLGDRRLARLICKESAYPLSAAKLLTTIQGILEHHRAGTAYPDDVTIVVVTRKA